MQETWYFRDVGGNVYGPAGIEELAEWAREGRITPDGYVSSDRRRWKSAPSLSRLGMDSIVEVERGKWMGPFHKDVINALKADGSLSKSAKVYTLEGRQTPGATKVVTVEKRVEVPVPVEVVKVVEKIVEKKVYITLSNPAPADNLPVRAQPANVARMGMFGGSKREKMAFLEDALRRELLAARRAGLDFNFFGRKQP